MLVLAILGFADTAYLSFETLSGRVPPCTIVNGCEKVLTSAFSHLGPIPISLFGVGYYVVVLILIMLSLDTRNGAYIRYAVYIVGLAWLASLGLFLIQALILHAYCFYCIISAGITTLLAICGVFAFKQTKPVTEVVA